MKIVDTVPWMLVLVPWAIFFVAIRQSPTISTDHVFRITTPDTRSISFPCAPAPVKTPAYRDCTINPLAGGKMIIRGTDAEWKDFQVCRGTAETQCVPLLSIWEKRD